MKNRLHKVCKGCRSFLIGANTFVWLIIFSFCASFLIVFPLWKLAVSYTKIYTIMSITFFSLIFLSWFVRICVKKYKRNPRTFFYNLIKKAVLIIGIVFFLFFLFRYQRSAAFAALAASIIVNVFLSFGFLEDKE
ncbi:MAG: hypothetical protein ACTTI3_06850 [Treponema sp.]